MNKKKIADLKRVCAQDNEGRDVIACNNQCYCSSRFTQQPTKEITKLCKRAEEVKRF